jgi:hypothetical protein
VTKIERRLQIHALLSQAWIESLLETHLSLLLLPKQKTSIVRLSGVLAKTAMKKMQSKVSSLCAIYPDIESEILTVWKTWVKKEGTSLGFNWDSLMEGPYRD